MSKGRKQFLNLCECEWENYHGGFVGNWGNCFFRQISSFCFFPSTLDKRELHLLKFRQKIYFFNIKRNACFHWRIMSYKTNVFWKNNSPNTFANVYCFFLIWIEFDESFKTFYLCTLLGEKVSNFVKPTYDKTCANDHLIITTIFQQRPTQGT
jgi:hypothetical protein